MKDFKDKASKQFMTEEEALMEELDRPENKNKGKEWSIAQAKKMGMSDADIQKYILGEDDA